ncbi:MAG: protein translocase subunit SecD [Euzebyales bacterium]|nr:protein translocase subunit SecD [Euzebyales bacterium]
MGKGSVGKGSVGKGMGKLVAVLVAFLVVVAGMWGTIAALGWSPQLGLDLRGGVSITLVPAAGQAIDDEVLDQTVQIIRQRVDGLGVAEPEIARQGDTVLVQLPGVTDREQAEQVIGRTAQLQFRRVVEIIPPDDPAYADAGDACGQEVLVGPPPEDAEVVLCEGDVGEDGQALAPEERLKYRLGTVDLGGSDVTDAAAALDQGLGTQWLVNLELDGQGAQAFAAVTAELACEPPGAATRQFAVVLDGVVESAPTMSDNVVCGTGITGGSAVITTGGEDEARELALVLRTGALPIQLEFATSQSVSPTLGSASLTAGLQAGFIGLVLVALYLLALYRGIGLAAIAELAAFGAMVYGLIIVLGNTVGFTLTLAGIAGIIVSIGIAADSSIIYRERYRDEIRAGRTVRTAADAAFTSAFRTNLTGNTVSFLAAGVLYILAVGPVRGFAFTLGLSTLIDTLLFATFTRSLFGLIARSPKLATSRLMGLRADVVTPTLVDDAPAQPERSERGSGDASRVDRGANR